MSIREEYFYLCGIPFKFMSFSGDKACCRIGESRQCVYLSKKYFTNEGLLACDSKELTWFINKQDIFQKILRAAEEEKEYIDRKNKELEREIKNKERMTYNYNKNNYNKSGNSYHSYNNYRKEKYKNDNKSY